MSTCLATWRPRCGRSPGKPTRRPRSVPHAGRRSRAERRSRPGRPGRRIEMVMPADRVRVLGLVMRGAIRAYQLLISPHLPPSAAIIRVARTMRRKPSSGMGRGMARCWRLGGCCAAIRGAAAVTTRCRSTREAADRRWNSAIFCSRSFSRSGILIGFQFLIEHFHLAKPPPADTGAGDRHAGPGPRRRGARPGRSPGRKPLPAPGSAAVLTREHGLADSSGCGSTRRGCTARSR